MRFRRNTRAGAWREWHHQSAGRANRREPVDLPTALDMWLEIAGGDPAPGGPVRSDPSPEAVADLARQLLAVLDDETGQRSLVPPSAAHLSQEQWDALPAAERDRHRIEQLRTVDPRLLRRTVLNPDGPFRRSGPRRGLPSAP